MRVSGAHQGDNRRQALFSPPALRHCPVTPLLAGIEQCKCVWWKGGGVVVYSGRGWASKLLQLRLKCVPRQQDEPHCRKEAAATARADPTIRVPRHTPYRSLPLSPLPVPLPLTLPSFLLSLSSPTSTAALHLTLIGIIYCFSCNLRWTPSPPILTSLSSIIESVAAAAATTKFMRNKFACSVKEFLAYFHIGK